MKYTIIRIPGQSRKRFVFIHGFTENVTAWNAWIPYLSRNYRLLTFDLRGFGKTGPVPATFKYSTDLYVDDMVRIINHLVGEPVHLFSAKSGGIAVSRFAAQRPDLVRSIILGCPALTAPGSQDWFPFMQEHGVREWARKTMPGRLGVEASPACIDWWVDMMGATSMSTVEAYLKWVVTTAANEDLDKIKCPAFVVMTTLSEKTNAAAGQLPPSFVQEKMPQAEIFILDKDCYHGTAAYRRCVCAGRPEVLKKSCLVNKSYLRVGKRNGSVQVTWHYCICRKIRGATFMSGISNCLCLADFENQARRKLPKPIYGYIAAAAETGKAHRNNLESFQKYSFVTKVLVSSADNKTDVELMGFRSKMPFGIAPVGISALFTYRSDSLQAGIARGKTDAHDHERLVFNTHGRSRQDQSGCLVPGLSAQRRRKNGSADRARRKGKFQDARCHG